MPSDAGADFEVALGDPPTDDAPAGADDGADDELGEVEGVAIDRAPARMIKASTAAFARKIAEAHRGKIADGDAIGLAPVIGTEPRPAPTTPPPAPVSPKSPPEQGAAGTIQGQTPAAPAPEHVAAWEAINAERAQLARDREEIEQLRGRVAPLARGKLAGSPEEMHAAVSALLKDELGGDATEAEVQEAMSDLITELSLRMAGVTIPDSAKLATEQRRALRQIRKHNRELQKQEAEAKAKAERDEQRRTRLTTADQIGKEITNAPSFRFLTAADETERDGMSPGEFVVAVIEERYRLNRERLTWQEAAKLANDHFEKKARAVHDRWSPLLTPPTSGGSAAPAGQAHQGGRTEQQVSRTLTNAVASEPAALPEPDPSARFDPDEHRARTRAKWNGKIGRKVE